MDVDDIGEDDDALLCHTNKTNCCTNKMNQTRDGNWYYPNGTQVGIKNISPVEFYRDRGTQVVRLHHQVGRFVLRGRFRCEVPNVNGDMQSIYVYIGTYVMW